MTTDQQISDVQRRLLTCKMAALVQANGFAVVCEVLSELAECEDLKQLLRAGAAAELEAQFWDQPS